MIVVSDTSPVNYLVLINADRFLPALFGQVIAPPAVLSEMQHSKAPDKVRAWAVNPPAWLEVRAPAPFVPFGKLGPGESEAIALAQQIHADLVRIDERVGRNIAKRLGLAVARTLGVIDLAAEKGLLSLPTAIAELRRTTFRLPEKLVAELLKQNAARSSNLTNPADPS
jgi:predicted nucleic acid-binding protein